MHNVEVIKNALSKLQQLKVIRYVEKQNGFKNTRFGINTKDSVRVPEIWDGKRSGISLSDLTSLLVQSVQTVAANSQTTEKTLQKLASTFESFKKRASEKNGQKGDMSSVNKNTITNLREKMLKLEKVMMQTAENDSKKLVKKITEAQKKTDDKMVELYAFKKALEAKLQMFDSEKEEKDDLSAKERLKDREYFITLMQEARETFFSEHEEKGQFSVHDIAALWKGESAKVRGKMYRRVLARREDGRIFDIMDQKKPN
eukprot:g5814.t1